ncbi:uncharacterized protein TNCV_4527501 [Trichonephila clavipes]|nr:uncharacterized protein TNCV_4527501 [Trichonephila clavipes]
MPPDRQRQIEAHEIHRGTRQDLRLSLTLASSIIQWYWARTCDKASHGPIPIPLGYRGHPVPVRQVRLLYDRWRHHRSPPPQFRHRTGGEGNIHQPPALVVSAATAHKTFGPTDLTSTYAVCIRRVFGGIGHRTQASRSGEPDALPTA